MEGPILGTILRLATPTLVGSLAQIAVNLTQMHFIGLLGVDALAGVALVFPCLTLMQIVAGAGIGPGVASAVARSLGAGRRADAEALMVNAIFLAIGFGTLFTVARVLPWTVALPACWAGPDHTCGRALAYSNWMFGASVFVWILILLNNALIGCVNTTAPQIFSALALVVVPLSPAFMFGWGPLPPLGIAGAGVAFVCYYVLATAALIGYLRSGRAAIRLRLDLRLIEWRLLRAILQVGGLSALSAAIPTLSITLITAAVARRCRRRRRIWHCCADGLSTAAVVLRHLRQRSSHGRNERRRRTNPASPTNCLDRRARRRRNWLRCRSVVGAGAADCSASSATIRRDCFRLALFPHRGNSVPLSAFAPLVLSAAAQGAGRQSGPSPLSPPA